MSYKIIDSTENNTEGSFLGNTHTYEVRGATGASVRFEHTNSSTFPTSPKSITVTVSSGDTESTVVSHSWHRVRAIVVSGTPSYFVSSSKV